MRPYNRYTSRRSTTDALPLDTPVRPYTRYSSAGSTTDALRPDTTVRPYTCYSSRGALLVATREICGIYDEMVWRMFRNSVIFVLN